MKRIFAIVITFCLLIILTLLCITAAREEETGIFTSLLLTDVGISYVLVYIIQSKPV